jgi:hypothetical protein
MADDTKNGARALGSDPASEVGMEMTKGEEKRELKKKGEGDGKSERILMSGVSIGGTMA